jgi:hypothetical protein
MFHNLCDFIKDELKELDRKVASGGKLSMQEIEYADKLAHMKKSILTIDAMENPEEYYGDDRNYSNYGARGRRRDSMGRYSTNVRMYRDDDMMGELRELMEKAPNEQVRRKYREFISDMESMM